MKVVIIEDETTALYNLKAILKEINMMEMEVVAEIDSVAESVAYFRNHPSPDLIFMDIMLADGIAFRIFEQVEIHSPVIFTTAYDAYALQAFQVVSIDYLLKPLTKASMEKALTKLRYLSSDERQAHISLTNEVIHNRSTLKYLIIVQPHKFYPLSVEDILFFYTSNEKVTVWTADGKQHPVDRNLDALCEQLDQSRFFRANRQFIISRKAIKDVDMWHGSRLSVNLSAPAPERIVISKNKSPVFKKWLLMDGQ